MRNPYPWVYGIRSGDFIKVGSAWDIEARFKQLQLGNPHRMSICMRQMCEEARWLEIRMHQLLSEHAHRREWFVADVKLVKAALREALDDLAEKRLKQIAWETRKSDKPHSLALWNGRGIARPRWLNV